MLLAGAIQFSCGQTWRLIGTSAVENELQGCWITLQMVSSYKTVDDSPSPWGERAGVRASVFSTAPFRLRYRLGNRRSLDLCRRTWLHAYISCMATCFLLALLPALIGSK